ncbi:hypothetical protein OH807_09095 [Kitasatospora sp. NBC_01560]|uniref:Rv1733c family protein n=1 Tax=Kitasatospora sp. NBC_01560 TaxID=2975965 RepID=UPI003864F856
MSSTPPPARPAPLPRRAGRHLRRAFRTHPGALERPLDRSRSRAWVAAMLGVLLAPAAGAGTALITHHLAARDAAADRERLRPVTAVVRSIDRPTATPAARRTGGYRNTVGAEADWTGPDGQPHTGTIDVPRTTPARATVTLWVDRAGTPVDPPADPTGLAVDAVCAGLFGVVTFTAAAGGALALRLRTLDRRAGHAWARDWARHEPHWTGRTAGSPGGPPDD